jgi:hypothetical protein
LMNASKLYLTRGYDMAPLWQISERTTAKSWD